MRIFTISVSLWLSLLLETTSAFVPLSHYQQQQHQRQIQRQIPFVVEKPEKVSLSSSLLVRSAKSCDDDDEDNEKKENPYNDPNYPELEFVDYSDPEYQVDQGVSDEFYDPASTEEKIEEMRESRRSRNDEFQFETYYKEILRQGEEYKGEWTVYQTSTFIPDMDDSPNGMPKLAKMVINVANPDEPLKVVSRGERITLDDVEVRDFACDADRILHIEEIAADADVKKGDAQIRVEEELISTTYWPDQLEARDFRGEQGIMCVGNAYTICKGIPLDDKKASSDDDATASDGPFSEYRAEIGIESDLLRFRVKFDYSILEDDAEQDLPPLHLRSMTVCRETQGMWPRVKSYTSAAESLSADALFGPAGAEGGLYDPPPVGSDEQASQYMMLNLDGRATVLFPYLMDQDPTTHPDSRGWVTSLDWTPGRWRFQVDRKTKDGKELLGLRTLELTEVQSVDAETYRPRDKGADMRQ